jgi:APA family basic amino acid/polyamine antiporter
MSVPPDAKKGGEFGKGLGLLDTAALTAGGMIGSGIFVVSQDVAMRVGSPGWLLVVWTITGVMTVLCALAYFELAAMFPQAGGQYVYLREAYGPLWGFLYGWTLFLVIQTGSIAAVSVVFARYLSIIVQAVSGSTYGVVGERSIAIVLIAALTAINCVGLKAGKWVQNVFTVLKVLTLAAIVVLGFVAARADGALFAGGFFEGRSLDPEAGTWSSLGPWALLPAIGVAMVGSLFAADAWNNATFVAAEVRNPRRNVGLALILGVGVVIGLYLLVNVAYLATLPMERIAGAANQRVAAEMMSNVFAGTGEVLLAAAVLVSTFGCDNGMILSGARLVYAMARDGLFFSAAGKLGRRSGVPVTALVVQGIWSAALVLTGSYSDLLDYVIFASLIFYVLTLAGIFVLRRKRPDAERPYKAWGYPWMPILYMVMACFIMAVLLVYKPLYTWPGLGIVVLGVPVFYIWRAVTKGRAERAAS